MAEQCHFEGMKNMSNYWLEGTAPKLLCKGRIGDWKNHFTPEQNKMFENEVMNKLIGTGLEFDFEVELVYCLEKDFEMLSTFGSMYYDRICG